MPPNNHAVLSASSSHRWMQCTPSARLELEFEGSTSQAAAEGSAAHALAEHKLKRALKLRSQRPISPFEDDAMDEYTTDYVSFVLEQFYEMKDGAEEDPLVLIEQRLDFSSYVPDGFGTGDAVLLAPGKLHVIDFKYGQGVLVEAEHNSQMMLYALAALKKYSRKYKVKRVSMSIFQPRRENVSTWTITATELRKWAKTVLIPKAKAAYNGDGEYLPGEHCQFCKAAARCRARAEEKLKLAQREFSLPPLLTDEEIEEILVKLPDITKWANELMAYVNNHMEKKIVKNNGEIPMYYAEGTHEAIVDKETFEKAQSVVKAVREKYCGKNSPKRYPFTSTIKCGLCGENFKRVTANGRISWNCRSFQEQGRAFCKSKSIPETTLISVTAEVLGLDSFDEKIFYEKIDHIKVPGANSLIFYFKDGRSVERKWKDRSRSESWTPEMREAARQRAIKQRRDK